MCSSCAGVPVPLRDVKEKVDELKVQLDNLCQVMSPAMSLKPNKRGFSQSSLCMLKSMREHSSVNIDALSCCMQFLPQDKVVEFARLRPGQLLEETEKAIGDSSLHKPASRTHC